MALYAGELIMKNGGEVYRAEETIERICRACKIDYVECFATTTGIFLSLDTGNSDDDVHTFIKRLKNIDIDLRKISLINNFSREFTSNQIPIDEAFQRLKRIDAEPKYPIPVRLLGAILVGFSLCLVFGGGVVDSICAGVIGGCIYGISMLIEILEFPIFIRTFVGCGICAFLAIIAYTFGICDSLAPVITASMSIYLPGVAITNAARDMLSGDMLSGVARFTEAILLAIGIAGGVGMVLKFYSLWYTGQFLGISKIHNFWILSFCMLIAVLGFCILFHSPKSTIIYACIIGAVGQIIMQYLVLSGQSPAVSCFAGACALAILAECGSRAGRDATTTFIIPGIIPLVPGSILYDSMLNLLGGDLSEAGASAGKALAIALCIAAALVVISSLTRLLVKIVRKTRDYIQTKSEKKKEIN